jgi:hypothetical protein
LLFRPESLKEFAIQSPAEVLGSEKLAWLRSLPHEQIHGPLALVHASPGSLWRAPAPEASDAELESVYSRLGPLPSMRASIAPTLGTLQE